ncbi:MAG: hypothetical protein JW902_13515 [Syntrophaceae bacterium]|nr:hypothetical protein [Syntrophaceae bacterium]
MKKIESIIESKGERIVLTFDDASNLTILGQKLASKKEWWGVSKEDDHTERSIITCYPDADHKWFLKVHNAIGIIATGDLQITISPKIPSKHFLHIVNQSKIFPRVDEQQLLAAQSKSFIDVVAIWFIEAAEKLLRGELIKGYSEISDMLNVVRGKIRIIETSQAFYSGLRGVHCQFEDFNTNIIHNRVIKAAAEIVAGCSSFEYALRRKAKAIYSRMEGVGDLQQNDLRYTLDRLTYHYRDVLIFSKYLITSAGVQIFHGAKHAWSFLIRTPDIIEAGLREILTTGLADYWTVKKKGILLDNSKMSLTPDLNFNDGMAVGDIKYKLANGAWERNDLYQITTFAAGFKSKLGLIIGFNTESTLCPPPVKVGDLFINYFAWDAREGSEPEDAANKLLLSISNWLIEMLGK